MTEHTELHDGLWLSVAELALRMGVRNSTILEKVERLVEAGLLTTKPGAGKVNWSTSRNMTSRSATSATAPREQGAATKREMAGGEELPASKTQPQDSGRFRDRLVRRPMRPT